MSDNSYQDMIIGSKLNDFSYREHVESELCPADTNYRFVVEPNLGVDNVHIEFSEKDCCIIVSVPVELNCRRHDFIMRIYNELKQIDSYPIRGELSPIQDLLDKYVSNYRSGLNKK